MRPMTHERITHDRLANFCSKCGARLSGGWCPRERTLKDAIVEAAAKSLCEWRSQYHDREANTMPCRYCEELARVVIEFVIDEDLMTIVPGQRFES